MQTITINANINSKVIESIKNIVRAIDPNSEIFYSKNEQNSEYELSEADKDDLREILAQRERGELEFISHDEFKQHKIELFARLGEYAN